MKKLIGLFLVLSGLSGIIMAMNENAGFMNFIGVLIFGFSMLLGAKHAKDELHPIDWIINEYEGFKQYLNAWRL